MKRAPVDSSNIKSIGHDPETNTLEIEFHNGGVYQYHGVTAAKHTALLTAESHGAHLNQYIKPKHPFTKLPKL